MGLIGLLIRGTEKVGRLQGIRAGGYASDLAEQRIRHEMRQSHENVFKKLFDVDVNVELRSDSKPMAYRIMTVHTVTDAPDEDD